MRHESTKNMAYSGNDQDRLTVRTPEHKLVMLVPVIYSYVNAQQYENFAEKKNDAYQLSQK